MIKFLHTCTKTRNISHSIGVMYQLTRSQPRPKYNSKLGTWGRTRPLAVPIFPLMYRGAFGYPHHSGG